MLYCDYDTYSAMGGTMSAEQYGLWGPRASRKIDELTLGRADAALAASIFPYNEIPILVLKRELKKRNINVRL